MNDFEPEPRWSDAGEDDVDVEHLGRAASLLDEFAADTGLTDDRTPDRYLWTDAFAVCTWLGLHEATGEERHRELALRLIDQVHRVLGRHRADDARSGWISGLDEEEGERRPTAGGLRIGKDRPERGPAEPFDPRAEWERDGQYYHYLTRWMHALGRAHRSTGDDDYLRWALELAEVAHAAFVHHESEQGPRGNGGEGRRGIHWKMSVDLTRSLVPTEGQHDPLDGLVTVRTLRAISTRDREPALQREEEELAAMCHGRHWQTNDPLGIGGLLAAAWWSAQLRSADEGRDEELLATLVEDAAASLRVLSRGQTLSGHASRRLPFRELGLSIGLTAGERLVRAAEAEAEPGTGPVEKLERHLRLGGELRDYWLDPRNREADTWTGHEDINRVTLAAALAPDGYLKL